MSVTRCFYQKQRGADGLGDLQPQRELGRVWREQRQAQEAEGIEGEGRHGDGGGAELGYQESEKRRNGFRK